MSKMNWFGVRGAALVTSCAVLTGVGCDYAMTSQAATITGEYLGELVSVVVTGYLQDELDLGSFEAENGHDDGEEHSHAADPLHDFEH